MGRPLKMTVVGDGTVGKTCLLVAFAAGGFPTEYVPTVFENYSGELIVDGLEYHVTLWDTAGQEDYARLRPIAYPNTDVFILCYAVNNESSFAHVESKWVPELRQYCPKVPIVLVATKIDKRQGFQNERFLASTADGEKLKRKIRAAKYVECSAMNMMNVKGVFEESVRACLTTSEKQSHCLIL